MTPLAMALAGFLLGSFVGVFAERIRKIHDMHLDAENGVIFVAGVPHVFRRYGPEQNYDD
jgi:hypothetical protein